MLGAVEQDDRLDEAGVDAVRPPHRARLGCLRRRVAAGFKRPPALPSGMSDDPASNPVDPRVVDLGEPVFDADGNQLGTVRGFDEDGIYVTTREGIEALSMAHEHPGPRFGEAELLWRCSACGEMGDLEAFPDACPNCGAPREQLYYWTED